MSSYNKLERSCEQKENGHLTYSANSSSKVGKVREFTLISVSDPDLLISSLALLDIAAAGKESSLRNKLSERVNNGVQEVR